MTEGNIGASTLRDMLERGERVTVVDIRKGEDRAEWSIPGSVHYDAYDALNAGEDGAMEGLELPGGAPVVTVCGRGRSSAVAAEQLRSRGYEAFSLEDGMEAWSLAWNTAEVPLGRGEGRGSSGASHREGVTVLRRRVRRRGRSHRRLRGS